MLHVLTLKRLSVLFHDTLIENILRYRLDSEMD